jgi:hypothetical protein
MNFQFQMLQKIIQVGVRLNCICPSAVDTRMLRETFKNADVKEIFDSLGITIQRQVIININSMITLSSENYNNRFWLMVDFRLCRCCGVVKRGGTTLAIILTI